MFVVDRRSARVLLKELGFRNADKLSNKKLAESLRFVTDDQTTQVTNEFDDGFMRGLFQAVERGLAPVLKEGSSTMAVAKAKTKKSRKTPSASSEPKRRYKPSLAKPGICAFIVDMLKGRSSRRPITRREMLERVIKRFPDRDPDKMEATLKRFTSWVPKNHGCQVSKSGKGYWIETDD